MKFFQQPWLRKIVMVTLLIVANLLVPALEEAESYNFVASKVEASTESSLFSAALRDCCAGELSQSAGSSSYSCDNCQHCQSGHSDYQVASTLSPTEFARPNIEFDYLLVSQTPSQLLRPPIA